MIPANLRDIVDTLIANSRHGSLDWKEAPAQLTPSQLSAGADRAAGGPASIGALASAVSAAVLGRPESYTVSFPDLTVVVTRVLAAGGANIRLSVINQRGEEIAAATAGSGDADSPTLSELVDAARARARRVDEALDRLRGYLRPPGRAAAGRRVAPTPPGGAVFPLQGYYIQASTPPGDMDVGSERIRALHTRLTNLGMQNWVQSAGGAPGSRALYTAWPVFNRPVSEQMLRTAAEQAGLQVEDVIVPS